MGLMMKKEDNDIFSISFDEIGKTAVPATDYIKSSDNLTKPKNSRTKIGAKKKS
jgi:hypothetical protein